MTSNQNLPSYNIENITVLVVDGHEQIRIMIRDVLRKFNIRTVMEATTIEEGYNKICDANPDVIFVDWTPEFDGINLLQKVRTSPDSPNPFASIIVMTGFSEVHYVISARDAGMNSYLTKPVSARTLYKHIVSLIENKRTFIKSDEFMGPDRRHKRKQDFQGTDKRTTKLSTNIQS